MLIWKHYYFLFFLFSICTHIHIFIFFLFLLRLLLNIYIVGVDICGNSLLQFIVLLWRWISLSSHFLISKFHAIKVSFDFVIVIGWTGCLINISHSPLYSSCLDCPVCCIIEKFILKSLMLLIFISFIKECLIRSCKQVICHYNWLLYLQVFSLSHLLVNHGCSFFILFVRALLITSLGC